MNRPYDSIGATWGRKRNRPIDYSQYRYNRRQEKRNRPIDLWYWYTQRQEK